MLRKFIIILLISGLFSTVGCAEKSQQQAPRSEKNSLVRKKSLSNRDITIRDATIFYAHVADRIAREYVEPVDQNTLLEGALNGMLQALDPHSAYLDAKKFDEIKKQTHGEYGGLGLEITMDEGVIKVVSPIEDTPAFRAGIKTGDLIIMINEEPVYGMSIIEASEKLKGEPHTKVRLLIRRGHFAPFELELTREKIKVHPIKFRVEDNIGYIRITTFNEHTAKELRNAIHQIQKQLGSKMIGLLIDVRNNAGGLLDQAIETTDLFLDGGDIVSILGRDPTKDIVFKANKNDILKGLPIVVLINGGSASASEILAGALQDHKRAIIVGTKSFGKGSVQTVIPMTNGGALKLTTALYYTPSGRSIQKTGIIPDITIEQQVDLKTINEDKRYREANLQKALGQGGALGKNNSINDSETNKDQADTPHTHHNHHSEHRKPLSAVPPALDKDKSERDPSKDKDHTTKKDKDYATKEDDLLKEMPDYQLHQAFNVLRAIALQKTLSSSKK
jgi:carboxyl-terminal processing protease